MQKLVYFKDRADTKICLLSVMYVTSLLANLAMGYRYISLGKLDQSGGIFIFPLSFIISDIITEIYGAETARKLVGYGIACQIIFALYAFIIIHLPAPEFLSNKETYFIVFNSYLNFALASTVSIWIGSKINIVLLSKLSEFNGGKYFAARSLLASTAGEFLVTLISMFLANFNKMSIDHLLYMIICCFLVKTIISFVAIWPAALVVHGIENPREFNEYLSVKNLLSPIRFIKNLLSIAWNAKGYIYNLESINLDSKKVSLYFKGTRGVVTLFLENLVFDFAIINRMKSVDVAHVGYYYAVLEEKNSKAVCLKDRRNLMNNYNSDCVKLSIKGISRDGKLIIEDMINLIVIKKCPMDLYRNKMLMENFSTNQAFYIGYLAGLSEFIDERLEPKKFMHLQLVK